MHEPERMQSGGTTHKTNHLRILAQKWHIRDGVYSEGGFYAAERQACRLCKDGHVKNEDLLPLRAGQSISACVTEVTTYAMSIKICELCWPQQRTPLQFCKIVLGE